MVHRPLDSDRLYRTAQAVAHAARVFVSSVLFALVLVHIDEGARIVPLALTSLAFVVTPTAYEAIRTRRQGAGRRGTQ